jgi:hypothetical protein
MLDLDKLVPIVERLIKKEITNAWRKENSKGPESQGTEA